MKPLLSHLKETDLFKKLDALLSKDKIEISDTNDAVNMVLIQYIFTHSDRSVLVVNHNLYHAQKTYDTLNGMDITPRFFPQDEFLTTDMLAMSEDLKFERLDTINTLLEDKKELVVTHPTGLLKYLPPKAAFKEASETFEKGDEIEPKALLDKLVALGYTQATEVEKVGDYAKRGSIVDVFPMGYDEPVRFDFFDIEIDSIRTFDVSSQRSKTNVSSVTLFPRAEFFYDDATYKAMEKTLRERIDKGDFSEATVERLENELLALEARDEPDRFSRYMGFAYDHVETLSDYMNDPIIIAIDHDAINATYTQIVEDLSDWMMETGDYPSLGFEFIKDLDNLYCHKEIRLNPFESGKPLKNHLTIRSKHAIQYAGNMKMLLKDLKKYSGHVTTVIACGNRDRMDTLRELFEEKTLPYKILGKDDAPFEKSINLTEQAFPVAFEWFDVNLLVLNEQAVFEITQKKKSKKQKAIFKDTEKLTRTEELKKGDYVVHYDHGIGRYLGIKTMTFQGHTNDYITIAYKGDDTLYIPVENIHLIQKYSAHEGVRPKINKLGSADWAKTKQRVRKKAKNIASQLIDLYAKREETEGFAFSSEMDMMTTFEADFPYEETDDQLKAIEAVKADMEKPTPMDRLICGDVGYGKTEVALRATFKAVLDNKQVAYLAPTTILTRQHFYTFKRRLAKHGIKVALLNRFVSGKRQREYLEGIKTGKIDVVIGTHRILSKDIDFHDLGLLIVDEEQRFGVEHKEKIKAMKLHVDVLSLSATPIPRTLQMAMTGVKQMSLIETPPKDRFPIQTYVLRRNNHVIQDAIERELGRNGQVFYLYNKVEDIDAIKDELDTLVPDARVIYAHGKMNRNQLERVMQAFLDHEYDVLVSTTIIETGIDIQNANTLIVHDADKLGLSQLYQIRGRVGRSNRIAYSYLMYAKHKQLNEEAAKRLQAIKEFTELGSGYKIAARDLAIRGAGDLLGTEQSGFIDSVGIEMFMEILKEEIAKKKEEPVKEKPDESKRNNIKMPTSRSIPEDYVGDEALRIDMHRRIGAIESEEDYKVLRQEFSDRFGPVPKRVDTYMLEKLYEQLALHAGVERVHESDTAITFVIDREHSKDIHGEMLFKKANELSRFINLSYKQEKLRITMDKGKIEKSVLELVVPLLELLA
ncbi:MAG: transcription-repair coupling factor [Bacillota bacterium]